MPHKSMLHGRAGASFRKLIRHVPALESLEQRLQPGSVFLGLTPGSSFVGSGFASEGIDRGKTEVAIARPLVQSTQDSPGLAVTRTATVATTTPNTKADTEKPEENSLALDLEPLTPELGVGSGQQSRRRITRVTGGFTGNPTQPAGSQLVTAHGQNLHPQQTQGAESRSIVSAPIAGGSNQQPADSGGSRDVSAFPTPLQAVSPAGSLIYQTTATGNIDAAGATDTFTITLDELQSVTLTVDPTSTNTLQPTVSLYVVPPGEEPVLLGAVTASGAGAEAVLQTVPTADEYANQPGDPLPYEAVVSGAADTTGTYNVRLVLNAAVEGEAHAGAANDTIEAAQDLTPAFRSLVPDVPPTPAESQPSRAAVLGVADLKAGPLPNEVEPNDTLATANEATADFDAFSGNLFQMGIKGTVTSSGDLDFYLIGSLGVGDRITITLSGPGSLRGTLSDPFVNLLRGPAGAPINMASNDDAGPGLDSLIFQYTVIFADTYFVRASDLGTGTGTYDLALWLENTGTPPQTGGTLIGETEPNNSATQANDASTSWRTVPYLSRISGTVNPAGDHDYSRYFFTAGDLVTVNIDSTSTVDAAVNLRNSAGTIIAQEPGNSDGPGLDSSVYSFIIPTTGNYFVQVLGAGNGSYNADIYLSTNTPPPQPKDGNDYYEFSLLVGESASLAIESEADANVELRDASGDLVASGVAGPTNIDRAIIDVVATATGGYYVRVTGTFSSNYQLVVTRNAGFGTEPSNNFASAQIIQSSPINGQRWMLGRAAGIAGAASSGGSGQVNLPTSRTDGTSFLWDILQDGSILEGTGDSYDIGLDHTGFSTFLTAATEEHKREIVIGPDVIGGASVTRKVFVPTNQGYARFLEVVTNNGGTPINYTVPIFTNMGSDAATQVIGTSSGDGAVSPADNWIVTDDTNGTGDPTVLHVLAGPGGPQRPTTATFDADGFVSYTYDLTLSPGETKIVMHFGAQNVNQATALGKGPQLADLKLNALAGMTTAEIASVVNFNLTDRDVYQVSIAAGNEMHLRMFTPAGNSGELVNILDPMLRVFDAGGNLVASDDNSAADGRNAQLSYVPPGGGSQTFFIEVATSDVGPTTAGEYVLQVGNTSAGRPPFEVTTADPPHGIIFKNPPPQITVHFNEGVLLTSVQAADLTVDGVPAIRFGVVDGDTIRFTPPPVFTEGLHNVAIAAGAISDLQGTPLREFAALYRVDLTAPRVNFSSIQKDDVVAAGNLTYTVGFDEKVKPANLTTATFVLYGVGRNQVYFPTGVSYNSVTVRLTVNYAGLPADTYGLTLLSGYGAGRVEDLVGSALDGEPVWPIPPNVSGNGVEGGNFFVVFSAD